MFITNSMSCGMMFSETKLILIQYIIYICVDN